MDSKVLITVIIPTYNSSKYIIETIDSVIHQTFKDFEIIIVDDSSTDNTVELIKEFKFENIKLYTLKKNSGASVARNFALSKARGRFIAFLDSDDIWNLQKLEKQINFMISNNYGFTYTSINIINENNQIIKKNRKTVNVVKYKTLLRNTVIATSTVIIDKNQFGDFRMPIIRSGQDYATWLMLLRDDREAFAFTESLTNYRKTENSLSSRKLSNFKKVYRIQTQHEKINKLYASYNVIVYLINAVAKHYF
jgi:teichuronic acid biosynthesis glycosyltransferase TuaG